MGDVLVLNYAYMPIRRVSWQEAFVDVWTGRAEVVENYVDRTINSASQVWPMPSIIRFIKKVRSLFKKGVKFNRKNVYLRDKGKCQYCGTRVPMSEFTYDHVIPRSQRGTTRWENIVVSCFPCNHKKRNRTPEQARMKLLLRPVRPKSVPHGAKINWSVGMPESWKAFLGSVSYWEDALESS